MTFPSVRYHASESPRIVNSAEEVNALGKEWADSPAVFGVETAPGPKPDAKIARAKKKAV